MRRTLRDKEGEEPFRNRQTRVLPPAFILAERQRALRIETSAVKAQLTPRGPAAS